MKALNRILLMLKDRSGATALEYCIIAGLISVAIVGGASAIGTSTNSSFVAVQEAFEEPI
jgi:pilus assembly protein Flp/PilA